MITIFFFFYNLAFATPVRAPKHSCCFVDGLCQKSVDIGLVSGVLSTFLLVRFLEKFELSEIKLFSRKKVVFFIDSFFIFSKKFQFLRCDLSLIMLICAGLCVGV